MNVESGSTLDVAGPAYIGYSGIGAVNVATGGQVNTLQTVLGVLGSGTLTVDGAGSTYQVAYDEAYETENGATTGILVVGGYGTGTVTVTGANSQLNVAGVDTLYVGYTGTGTLTVNQGGHVTSDNGFLGYLEGSTGTATVTGTDSQWAVGGNLYVGGDSEKAGGTGLLTVSDGGLVDVAGEMIVWQTGTLRGNGTVTVQDVTTLHNYGTIAPGSSSAIGTLTVNGNVDFAGLRDTADLEVIHVGLYGNLTCGKWYASSMASYGHVQYDTERFVDLTSERLTGDLNGNDWSAYVEAGQNLPVGPKTVMLPLVSLQYSCLGLGSYTETGGASALSYDDQSYQSVKGSLGARLTRQLFESLSGCRGDGQLRARWVHEFGDSQSSVDTAFASTPAVVFTIRDAEIARDSAVVGAGLGANITKQLRASADYDALVNANETVQMVSASLQYRW